jgi:uncharacterized protein with HEPN domain
MKKDDSVYLDHILASLNKIINYVNDHDLNSFLQSEQTQDAVIRQLEIVGEATKRISKEFRAKHNAIPWTEMAGMRDKLIHDYIDVDLWIVWETTQQDVPKLQEQLSKIA